MLLGEKQLIGAGHKFSTRIFKQIMNQRKGEKSSNTIKPAPIRRTGVTYSEKRQVFVLKENV